MEEIDSLRSFNLVESLSSFNIFVMNDQQNVSNFGSTILNLSYVCNMAEVFHNLKFIVIILSYISETVLFWNVLFFEAVKEILTLF